MVLIFSLLFIRPLMFLQIFSSKSNSCLLFGISVYRAFLLRVQTWAGGTKTKFRAQCYVYGIWKCSNSLENIDFWLSRYFKIAVLLTKTVLKHQWKSSNENHPMKMIHNTCKSQKTLLKHIYTEIKTDSFLMPIHNRTISILWRLFWR